MAEGHGLTALAAALALLSSVHGAAGQDKTGLAIDGYSCRELLRESGTDRDVALAFLHGYILGKAGATTLDVASLRKQSAASIDRCIDDPKATALEAMRGVERAISR